MNYRAIRAVIRKDLYAVLRSKAVLIPLILVPLFLLVVVPGITVFAGSAASSSATTGASSDITELLAMVPEGLRSILNGYEGDQVWIVFATVYMFAPLFLVLPMMVSSVIAADSFVGERERKTLEALLHTPLTNWDLLLAKMLSAWLAALAVSLIGFALYTIVVNVIGWPAMGRVFFPTLMWLVLVFWVAPAAAGLGLGTTVLISSRVNTFQEAYQTGGLIVIPIVALVIAQSVGVMYFSVGLTLLLGLGIWAIDIMLFWVGARTFKRDALITRL
jgi:ABC-2 type transport system permease protein